MHAHASVILFGSVVSSNVYVSVELLGDFLDSVLFFLVMSAKGGWSARVIYKEGLLPDLSVLPKRFVAVHLSLILSALTNSPMLVCDTESLCLR